MMLLPARSYFGQLAILIYSGLEVFHSSQFSNVTKM